MLPDKILLFLAIVISVIPGATDAKTIYINDRIMVGIHEDKSVDTPVLKLIPGGTALDLIKQDEPLSQIRDPDGVIGWVDNAYLVETEPGRAQLAETQLQMEKMEQEVERLQSVAGVTSVEQAGENSESLQKENAELKQLLKSERLRVGELQAQTAELKSRLSGISRPVVDTSALDKLAEENRQLRTQLENHTTTENDRELVNISFGDLDWRKLLVTIGISLLIGIGIGVYMLDLRQRKRHGGFRV